MLTDVPPVKRKLIDIVRTYQGLLKQIDGYLKQDLEHPEIAAYLGLSLTNYYTKRRGERRFSYQDVRLLLERFGSQEEIAHYWEFIEVRDKVYSCLQDSHIPLVQYRRLLNLQHYRDLARRRDHPDTWRIEDLELVGRFMESIAYCIG
ncbi:hypothetical protein [Spirosoma sordidisoli]|uniref:Uncharacterized protein n=1 Tax=Spirosoma sordidisoli TaxID=2502893 RepID=A0A4Q2UCW6_9BACT|nr:hypothetical protein [Spirosoma sordidisoli]RYC66636.1 hypothetical protein EQG79_29030 [Spirosoma sordidisoli]